MPGSGRNFSSLQICRVGMASSARVASTNARLCACPCSASLAALLLQFETHKLQAALALHLKYDCITVFELFDLAPKVVDIAHWNVVHRVDHISGLQLRFRRIGRARNHYDA